MTPDKQAGPGEMEGLFEAWEVIARSRGRDWTWANSGSFCSKLDAKAYLDAALMLMPEGWAWMTGCEPGEGFFATLSITDEAVERGAPDADMINCIAETPALAMVAAILKAGEAR